VSIHYTGWLYDPTTTDHHGKKFDSSQDRGQPVEFLLGAGHVIKGWDQGMDDMKVGAMRTLIVPPRLAYGASGKGAEIPPNATLLFEIELMGVRENPPTAGK
jgi:FKBP-type peptidyl-prolyl cis-trans isomerase